jgi:hypothetical protein
MGQSPGNERVSHLFPVITDGAKGRSLLGNNPLGRKTGETAIWSNGRVSLAQVVASFIANDPTPLNFFGSAEIRFQDA